MMMIGKWLMIDDDYYYYGDRFEDYDYDDDD